MGVSVEPMPEVKSDSKEKIDPRKNQIPDVYNTPNSGLKFDVEPGDNQADFDLK